MNIKDMKIEGVKLINNISLEDERGLFVKPFTNITEKLKKLHFEINEIYYTISQKNVIRGMHFQTPPKDHAKLVFLTSGELTDVLLDLRKSSKTYKNFIAINLSAHKNALFIPSGIAHGFLSNKDGTTIVYSQSSNYSKDHDNGILWSSFGYDWDVKDPILSERDKSFICFDQFQTPFY